MVTLNNIYSSDIKTALDWYKAYKAGCIPASLSEDIDNIMSRVELDLHEMLLGKACKPEQPAIVVRPEIVEPVKLS